MDVVIPPPPTHTKPAPPEPGFKSTEFVGKTIMQAVLVGKALFGLKIDVSDETCMQLAVGLEAVYGMYRTWLKSRSVTA